MMSDLGDLPRMPTPGIWYCASRVRSPVPEHQLGVLRRRFEAFEGEYSVKATESAGREELDSLRFRCTRSPISPHSRVFRQRQHIAPVSSHSPDLVQVDFLLFPKMKKQFKGHHFNIFVEIHSESQNVIDLLKGNEFLTGF
ncbi:uncharacterized protein LOC115216186 [Octopus sinensis]|uniref:Uncharacterized protein LOC115216186 n=1 Tax=Octopus sinensis TaxID=2607531 RepID=A0A6P7SSH9_9MOLL|nr:uncharacterized protein LOC115216186 [Octopus sinensis]